LSEAENRALYGKCNHPFGHGHDYTVEVSLLGPLDEHGRVASREALDRLVEESFLNQFRNANLNLDVAEFARLVPTSENVAAVIERRLSAGWRRAFPAAWPVLERVRLFETEKNVVEHMAPALADSSPADREELTQNEK
jgi:6-pyruvoyltetrahydropterin/6-carboxytetrahydropterin synthase